MVDWWYTPSLLSFQSLSLLDMEIAFSTTMQCIAWMLVCWVIVFINGYMIHRATICGIYF